jgi:RNA polymerase sigma-70 factor (ECF subfamily)
MVAKTDSGDEFASEPGATGGARVSAWQFRLVALRYHRLVYRFAHSLLKDKAEAEDVTQEAFLRYWEQGGNVRGPKEWLLTVARNACLDRFRRARHSVEAERAAQDEPSDDRGPAWHWQQHELKVRLQGLISTLPEPQRSLVVLFDVHGLDGAACARICGINTNQVKVYLHRARRRLRRELEGSE